MKMRLLGIAYVVAIALALSGVAFATSVGNGGVMYTADSQGAINVGATTIGFNHTGSEDTVNCTAGGFYTAPTTAVACVDTSGNLGLAGQISTYSNITTVAQFKGSPSNSGTNSYAPILLTQSNGGVTGSAKIAGGTCTMTAAASCTVTFSGGLTFTAAADYACAVDQGTGTGTTGFVVGNKATGSLTVYTVGGGTVTASPVVSCIGY
jgi:hypothetical protein